MEYNIKIKGNGCLKNFVKMLAWIELCGNVGHSASFKVFCDGDGATRYRFDFDDEAMRALYSLQKDILMGENINPHKDIKDFEI